MTEIDEGHGRGYRWRHRRFLPVVTAVVMVSLVLVVVRVSLVLVVNGVVVVVWMVVVVVLVGSV
jgi:hypothetical protein